MTTWNWNWFADFTRANENEKEKNCGVENIKQKARANNLGRVNSQNIKSRRLENSMRWMPTSTMHPERANALTLLTIAYYCDNTNGLNLFEVFLFLNGILRLVTGFQNIWFYASVQLWPSCLPVTWIQKPFVWFVVGVWMRFFMFV